MPILKKNQHSRYITTLRERYQVLMDMLSPRELKSPGEGLKIGSSWSNPESMCSTTGDKLDIDLAVADFKSILVEVKRI